MTEEDEFKDCPEVPRKCVDPCASCLWDRGTIHCPKGREFVDDRIDKQFLRKKGYVKEEEEK